MKPVYRTINVNLSRWQWQVVKASAKRWGIPAKDLEAHVQYLLDEALTVVAEELATETTVPAPRPVVGWDVRSGSPAIASRRKGEEEVSELGRELVGAMVSRLKEGRSLE